MGVEEDALEFGKVAENIELSAKTVVGYHHYSKESELT